jgi:hypothetical protein
MAKRTEAEMLSRAPLKAQLGNSTYELPILGMTRAAEWRELMFKEAAEAISVLSGEVTDLPVLISGLNTVLLHFPKKIAELVFAYNPELPKDAILASATEEQLAVVFSAIMEVAFPFGPILKAMQSAITMAAVASPSRKFTN